MNNPLISVPIPVYNVEPYLDSCLESVIGQTYHNIEVILLVQPCTDNSEAVAKEWEKKDIRVRIVNLPFADLANARNAGVENSLGDIICFVDSDDMLHKRHIENLLNVMEETRAEIVQGKVYAFHNQDKLPEFIPGRQKVEVVSARDFEMGRQTGKYGSWATVVQTKLYKKEVFKGVKFPTHRVCEDVATTFRIYQNAKNIAIIDSESYFYRSSRPDSITHDISKIERLVEHGYLARKDMYEYFNKKDSEIASFCAYYLCNDIVRAKSIITKKKIKTNVTLVTMCDEYKSYLDACKVKYIGVKRIVLLYVGKYIPFVWIYLVKRRKKKRIKAMWGDDRR